MRLSRNVTPEPKSHHCALHGDVGEVFIFTLDGVSDVFCLRCLRDCIHVRLPTLMPLNRITKVQRARKKAKPCP